MATRKTKKPTPISVAKKSGVSKLIFPAIIVATIILTLVFKGPFTVATVNGKSISRAQFARELEKRDGKTVLDALVTEQLILQEASKKKISVSDKEINDEIAKIEKSVSDQGQSLDSLLTQQNMSRNDLKGQIKLQLLLKKIVGNVPVSDTEVDKYIEENKDSLPEETNPEDLRSQIKLQLEQQKLNEKIQNLVAELQKNAKIDYTIKL
ncbi:MAG: hypothetical protein A2776_02790 [Candidatus Levybacteria bacterium RIFCSPHIGHO2_01_FULL_40_10]|nr:MAG: hypothetical protein A2776_02790 [Candidatus Levybacteria bacterium RIFCSPHIGHO2_01_FULL_40_10]